MAQQHPSTGTARRTVEAALGRRAPRWAGLALVLAAGCNDTSFFVKGDGEPEGLVPGSIQGRTCDPVGSSTRTSTESLWPNRLRRRGTDTRSRPASNETVASAASETSPERAGRVGETSARVSVRSVATTST
jgi:hypothetical protein